MNRILKADRRSGHDQGQSARPRGILTALLLAMTLAACGGGGAGGGGTPAADTCDVDAQKAWLRTFMNDAYYWTGVAPSPEPAGFESVQKYLEVLLYPGGLVGGLTVPKDRWSYIEDSAKYNQFFGEGKTMGYGLFVNGLELTLPLKVRYTEAQSPAALLGLVRGDTIVSLNGRSAADLIAANDFAALTPAKEGDTLLVGIESAAGARVVTLTAATFGLTPVPISKTITLPNGAKAGYLVLKDFVTQAEAPLASAITAMRDAGATDIIVDLRYNGGGRISAANTLASLIAGSANNGQVFTKLSYSARQASQNSEFKLSGSEAGFKRLVVLTGRRTCSASELLVNGLKPYLQVVTVGDTTCGKPFGFNPTASCGSTFSAVNFESFNALNQGRYYDGIAASCAAHDDFTGALGDATEPLTAAASAYLQYGSCPVVAGAKEQPLRALRRALGSVNEGGERQGMWAD